jgi:predicted DNA-binding transcriptional regulator YafY
MNKEKKLKEIKTMVGVHSRFVEANIKALQNKGKIYSSFSGQLFYVKGKKSITIRLLTVRLLTVIEHMFGIYFSIFWECTPMVDHSRRMERILKILAIVNQISDKSKINVIKLAKELEYSKKTIYKDIKVMEEAHLPVYLDKGLRRLPGNNLNIRPNFTPEELKTISSIYGMIETQKDYPYKKEIVSIREKMFNSQFSQELIETMVDKIEMYIDSHFPMNMDIFELLEQAIEGQKVIVMDYYSPARNTVETRKLDPYAIFFRKNAWYTAGFCHNHQEVRNFNMVRIKKIELTDTEYERPEDFSMKKYLEDTWEVIKYGDTKINIKVKFTGLAANIVKDMKRHPSQKIEELEDGSIIYFVTLEDWEEFSFWIAGYGASAEVIEPADFREYMIEQARGVLKVYGERSCEK